MSRIGNKPIAVSNDLKINIDDENHIIEISNGKNSLSQEYADVIDVKLGEGEIVVSRQNDENTSKALHGLYRSLIHNMVVGLTEGYKKTLDINGIGFRANLSGKKLELQIGYSHPVVFEAPEGIEFELPTQTQIIVKGYDKQLVGEVAAKIRASRIPDVYHGKGIKYSDEVLRIKEGKTGAKG
ncbi:50S ribosomal protein L6 [Fastidiosipila sanguinis]|uniref:Large ribosomal subunit protein uL6 n=1 Tax=Fastidiosipila sanguinis TaxID=236753 RepID=A0A2S0KLS8_9FIRM|nr:50S ribosomal protein L6 [Fastidiosipila sanguinis]AVM41959.1 50S ribosomal protein L6 [Fastidiosipila sanguinis]